MTATVNKLPGRLDVDDVPDGDVEHLDIRKMMLMMATIEVRITRRSQARVSWHW